MAGPGRVVVAIGIGALVAFPILMARRAEPARAAGLFRRRRFATINLSTLLIYGALYTIFTFQGLFLQNASATRRPPPGRSALPTGILLTLLSARIGTLAGRIGRGRSCRGPMLMAWAAVAGRGSRPTRPWQAAIGRPHDLRCRRVDADRRPADDPAVRLRDLAGRRAADDDADVARCRWATPGSRRRSTTRSRGSGSRSCRR